MFTITCGGYFNLALSAAVKNIQDILRKDAGVDGDAQRISQLAWMIFLKILDDSDFANDNRSLIPDKLRWRNWADSTNGLNSEDLIEFVNNELFKALKTLTINSKPESIEFVVGSVFEDAFNYMKSGSLLRQVISKIDEHIDFKSAKQRHLFGEIYEKILRDLQSAGNAGEFYTPRAVTEFMVAMVNPQLGEKVLDPACGTGGFLTCGIEHLRSSVKNESQNKLLQNSILGIEKKPLPHLLCVTNMLLHGVEVPHQIFHKNALSDALNNLIPENSVDVIVTNPPFGGIEEDGISINVSDDIRTKETADLFVMLIIRLLKKNGRAAIVLHDGFLKGEGTKTRIKEKLLKECNLHTIVRLPKGVFSPYTDITTNILFFDKGKSTKEIWFYEHHLPDGYKTYSKTKPITLNDLEPIMKWWRNRGTTDFAWKVKVSEVIDNHYNLNIKNPYQASNNYGDPNKLLKEYRRCLSSIDEISQLLKQELAPSLSNGNGESDTSFFENFNLITNTPSGIAALRELVLQLAMQGRLIQHDCNDEPAHLLMRQIQKLKAQKMAASKNGLVVNLPPVDSQKASFSLPDSWLWVRLGEISQIVGGGTPKTNNPDYFADDGIPWLTPADLYRLKEKYISRGKRDISPLGLQKSAARLLPPGAVLFSSRAPIGYVAIAANELATNQGFKSCVPFIPEMSEFIYYFLTYASKEIDQNASGATFKEVSGKIVNQIVVPLPPLVEQKRIVAKLDRLMTLLAELEAKFYPRQMTLNAVTAALVHQVADHQHASTSLQSVPHRA